MFDGMDLDGAERAVDAWQAGFDRRAAEGSEAGKAVLKGYGIEGDRRE